MSEELEIHHIIDTEKTIAKALFVGLNYPWEALNGIGDFIMALGAMLEDDEYAHPAENIWIAKDATVYESAYIKGPCIIDKGAEIRHCAFIRGSVIVGKGCVVGNSVELKNVVLFDEVQVPHYNYVGDSILGYKAHLGAGAITSNIKSDKTDIVVKNNDEKIATGRRKFGAIIGDYVEIGCNSVMKPGTIVGRGTTVYPLSSVRGVVPPCSIYKNAGEIVEKKL